MNRYSIYLIILFVVLFGIYFAFVYSFLHWDGLHLGLTLTVSGTFGGFIYSIRERKLIFPNWHKEDGDVSLGFVADCLYGMAGGSIVFLLVPGNFSAQDMEP